MASITDAVGFDWDKVVALTHRSLPDELERMSERQRARRLKRHPDLISLLPMSPALRQQPREFLRVVVGIPTVPNPPGDLRFECWMELRDFRHLEPLIRSRDDGTFNKVCHGKLANEIPGYPNSLGLVGECRFRDKVQVPYLLLTGDHPLVVDQRNGFDDERLMEWLLVNAMPAQRGGSS